MESSEVRYQAVARSLRDGIAGGEYATGARLPSESELAAAFAVSRGTVRQAFAVLRAEGLIASRRGARRVVTGGERTQGFAELMSFSAWARSVGEVPGGRVVELLRRPASAVEAAQLDVDDDAPIYHLTRVRTLSGRAVMIERTAYVERVGALLPGIDMATESVTERLAALGIVLTEAEHRIDAVAAGTEDAALLDVAAGSPLLRTRRRTTDQAGDPIEWSADTYRSDAAVFVVHNSAALTALARVERPVPSQ
ncbi:GntR family transcriptional regulator [Pseudonocardia sp. GCM10023141]|uniref:GntR family transcriptional regulator n=1 Tax=Pseudonocardia sp. GCM10023141 TaxID=3252653 RepID=UPI0036237B1C